jgi:2-polyprenyl-3-methyl-5-hydroxy-6-metoxy-1,4-benzoquinol methylase
MSFASGLAASVADSPYQFKQSDPYSSHSVILRLAGNGEGRRLLDVGAAHGYLAAALGKQGYQVTGIEADRVLGEEASKHCDQFLLLDLDGSLPDFPQLFDVIVFGDVLEHLKNPEAVLRQLAKSLKPDGAVIISLPNIANIYVRLSLLLGRFDYQDRGILDRTHLHFFTRKTFRQFLLAAGLEAEQLTATPIPLPLVVPQRLQGALFAAVHAANAWLALTWQTLFGYQFVALARKKRLYAS